MKKKLFGMVLILTLFLFACSNEQHLRDLHNYITKLKKVVTRHKMKDIIAEIKFPTPVQFKFKEGQRDPFQGEEQATQGQEESNNPLTAFPLRSFEFVGMIIQNKQPWAVIKAPDNKMYQVTIKDQIGNHYGRIIEIQSNQLKVEEEVPAKEAGVSGKGATKQIVILQLKGES